ncbi:unnamed protein product [Phytomonas sp. Hart1]|nr:unnamed protein product [Phytomonas sp. Hart1]|eukprot:CCW68201.1 unnamed protein product [Phytomonas sp. isolate Hart1]
MAKGAKKHSKPSKGVSKKNSKNDPRKRKGKTANPASSISHNLRAELEAVVRAIEREEPAEPPIATVKKEKPAERRRREMVEKEGIEVKSGMTLRQACTIADRRKRQQQPPKGPDVLYARDGGEPANGEHTEEDYSDTANERAAEYRRGGYHPVVVGDIYHNRYRIAKKLGWGYFSTVWLVWDYQDERYQAMKVQKSAKHYSEAAYDEIRLLSEIMQADPYKTRHCARLNDYFEHAGPNGTHVCMVFDVYGENLLCLMERYEYRGIPLPIVKCITRQILIALEHISSINIIHTDLKPENVLLSTPKHSIISLMRHYHPLPMHQRPRLTERDPKTMTKSQRRRYYKKIAKEKEIKQNGKSENETAKSDSSDPSEANSEVSKTDSEWEVERFHHVILADFGNSCWTYKQFTDEVQTRQYRCPEVILGEPYSSPIDIWSCACMIFELITGEFLFDPKKGDAYSRDEDHLALMSELLGDLPEGMRLGNGEYRGNYYTSRGELRNIKELRYWDLEGVLHKRHRFTRKKAKEIANFLLPMLIYTPESRATASQMLRDHEGFFEIQEDDYEPFCFNSVEVAKSCSEGDPQSSTSAEASEATSESSSFTDEIDGCFVERRKPNDSERAEAFRYWEEHPILNRTFLEGRGLTIADIQAVLSGKILDSPAAQDAANEVIRMLSEETECLSTDITSDGFAGEESDANDSGYLPEDENSIDEKITENGTGGESSSEKVLKV